MNLFGGAEKLIGKVNEIHEKFIETQTEFRLLREQSQATLAEFKGALERIASKLDAVQFDQVNTMADLRAEIKGVDAKLQALSHQALHAVAEKAAREGFRANSPDAPAILTPPSEK